MCAAPPSPPRCRHLPLLSSQAPPRPSLPTLAPLRACRHCTLQAQRPHRLARARRPCFPPRDLWLAPQRHFSMVRTADAAEGLCCQGQRQHDGRRRSQLPPARHTPLVPSVQRRVRTCPRACLLCLTRPAGLEWPSSSTRLPTCCAPFNLSFSRLSPRKLRGTAADSWRCACRATSLIIKQLLPELCAAVFLSYTMLLSLRTRYRRGLHCHLPLNAIDGRKVD